MCATRNKLFAKYGHDCEITSSWEDLPMFQNGGNILTQIKRILIRFRMASELNVRGNRFLQSQKALEAQHRLQMKHLHIIHPFSVARKLWEAWMVLVLATVFVTIPLDLASYKSRLDSHLSDCKSWKTFRLILDLICCTDVLMNFFTGYCDHKNREVVMKPRRIALRYCCTYFVFDLLSSIPTHMDLLFPWINDNSFVIEFLQFAGLGKALRFLSFQKYSKRLAEAFSINFAVYKVLQVMFCYLLYTHVITCINMVIYGSYINTEYTSEDYFFTFRDANNNPVDISTAYLGTLYRTIHLVSNSAPGISPINAGLKVYIMLIWFASRIMFFFLIAQLLDVVASTGSSTKKYREMVRQLREYMSHKQLPEMLQRRLIGYYEFRFQKSYFRESEILNAISGQLRQEIVMHSCRKLVENVEFFKNLPLPLIIRIVSALVTDIYLVNDVIIKSNTIGNSMYFIASGCVAIYTPHGTEICHLEDGDYFGEIALVKEDNMREASVVAVEMCELYRLDRREFTRAILPYPDLMEKIKKIAFFRQERTQHVDERSQKDILLRQ